MEKSRFISWLDITQQDNLYIALAEFHYENYDMSQYQHYDVMLPVHIEKCVSKRQAEYLAGRICAQQLLALTQSDKYSIATGELGQPVWPKHLLGSISHSNRYAISVIGSQEKWQGVGIDIEQVVCSHEMVSVMKEQVLNEQEYQLINSIEGMSLNELMTLCFSVKESFYKAVSGIVKNYLDFDDVQIIAINPEAQTIKLKPSLLVTTQFKLDVEYEAYYYWIDSTTVMTLLGIEL